MKYNLTKYNLKYRLKYDFLQKAGDEGPGEKEYKFRCDPPCSYGCTRNWQLVRHKMGTRCYHKLPFVCDICNKRFRDLEMKELHFEKGRCSKENNAPPAVWFDMCAK